MPAHDEASVIALSLSSIAPQLGRGDRLLVVADNCSDDTARIASECGAEVAIRHDPELRGKGYALDFGLRRLYLDPPDVVIMIDADCEVREGALEALARLCVVSSRPVQALYLMEGGKGGGKAKLAEFAWLLKNYVRPLGLARLGLPCQLMGTGMAFPWTLVPQMNLAHAGIVEDMQLGIDLALVGYPPLFCPEAVVTSAFPWDQAAVASQRARWEHGHLGMILSGLPRLLAAGVVKRDVQLLGLALDLAVPPFALLALAAFLSFAGGLMAGWLDGAEALLFASALPLFLMTVAVVWAWFRWGRQLFPFSALCRIPWYVATKIPLYLRFLVKRQAGWVKTGRN
jgi:glycosyltransferase involved in cell wall biosynthesis